MNILTQSRGQESTDFINKMKPAYSSDTGTNHLVPDLIKVCNKSQI